MIKLRKMETDDRGSTRRACGGCGKSATHQIVGQTITFNTPSTESVDVCKRCGSRLADAFRKAFPARRKTRRA